MAKLTGAQYEQLQDALLSAYPSRKDLRRMVRLKLDRNLEAIVEPASGRDMVFDLIGVAEAEGWTSELVSAAQDQNPANPELAAIDFAVAAGVSVRRSVQLEVLVSPDLGFLDLARWAERLPAIERRVGSVELDGHHRGTGFLVGPDVVMTNHHVMAAAIANQDAAGWAVRFDWSWDPDSGARDPGTQYDLAEDWLLDHSPHSEIDTLLEPGDQTPGTDELDYALVRIAPEPKVVAPDAPADRGWIDVSNDVYAFDPESFLMIAQHPCGDDIKMAIDPRSVLSLNGNATRVRYRTNTQPGSSGSPCFSSDLELVALHHAGLKEEGTWPPPDPCKGDPVDPIHNQGIPIRAIVDLLEHRGKRGLLGG